LGGHGVSDPISKQRKKNRGQLPQYYVEDTHPAIIDKATFDYVQEEIARRKELGPRANKSLNLTCFSGMLKCPHCGIREEKSRLEDEMSVLVEMTQNIVAENARIAQDQDEYQKRYNGLVQRYDAVKARYDDVVATISAKEAQSERLENFIKVLKAQDGTIREFDCSLWGGMVEFLTVGRNKEITVTFRDGTEIQA